MNIEHILPENIEKRSFEIIEQELNGRYIPPMEKPIVKRVIHTTADFDYLDNLCFSENAVEKAIEILKKGAVIVTDTNMAKSGINKNALKKLKCRVECFMADADVAEAAKAKGITRASASVDKAALIKEPLIYAVVNAPTALIRLEELIKQNVIKPELIIGVPVGFVNVVQSKEIIMNGSIPYIVAKGRKGGSNVAAAICNALLYMIIR